MSAGSGPLPLRDDDSPGGSGPLDSERRLRRALRALSAGVCNWNLRTREGSWDDVVHALLGFRPDEPRSGDAWVERIHPDDRADVLARIDHVLATPGDDEWAMEFRVVHPDGSIRWVQAIERAERDEAGQVVLISGINVDMTERRRTDEALRHSRAQSRESAATVRLLLETAPQGILTVDEQGLIESANSACARIFGWPAAALIGRPVEDLIAPADRGAHEEHRVRFFAAGAGLPQRPMRGQRQDGSAVPLEVTINHVATAQGQRAVAFVADISARQAADEALKRSHAALQERTQELERRTAQLSRLAADLTLAEQRAREQLARTLHDDLQQLLYSTRLRLERLGPRLGVLAAPEAALLEGACHELDAAIAAARSFAVELFPRSLHEHGLPAALAWLAGWMREKYGLTVHLSVPAAANPSRKDVRTLLFESVRELLFNIVKHAGVTEAFVTGTVVGDGSLQLDVSDHGVGFDTAAVLRAASASQSGLGLVSIQERLALLGGGLDIESAPARGARFRLVGPPAMLAHDGVPPPAAAVAAVDDRPGGGGRPLRILLVDDHVIVRQGLRDILSERPEFQVVGEAADGLQAVVLAAELQPDAVVMDVSMPVLDGVEATRLIRAQFPDVEVFGLSTQERTDDLHAIERAGAAGYFTKGADAESLIERLRRVPERRVTRP